MTPEPDEQRDLFAQRCREAGLGVIRFVPVEDGAKVSYADHSDPDDRCSPDNAILSGNYGIVGGHGGADTGKILINVDIDDYDTEDEDDALQAILDLPDTFTVASPHTDGETGGHRFYAVPEEVVERIKDLSANRVTNLEPSWGEIRIDNQYVVGPGSQIDDCKHNDPDRDTAFDTCPSEPPCDEPDGGYYEATWTEQITEIGADEFIDALTADPNYPERGSEAGEDTEEADLSEYDSADRDDIERPERAENAEGSGEMPEDAEIQRRLERMFNRHPRGDALKEIYDGNYGVTRHTDRSSPEYWLACCVDQYVGFGDKAVVAEVLDNGNLQKWGERDDESYRESTLRAVGDQEWYDDSDIDLEKPTILQQRDHVPMVESVDFPGSRNFVLDKPPREGGSYAMLRHFVSTEDRFVAAAPRHSILKHHAEDLSELLPPGGMGAVHLQSSHDVCEHDGDGPCPRAPEGYGERSYLEDEARDLLYQQDVVTADDAPPNICPYSFLLAATEHARAILTVPELLWNSLDGQQESEFRLFLDEEQSIDYFYPPSVTVCDIEMTFEMDGTPIISQRNTNLSDNEWVLDAIIEDIEADQEQRAEENDGDWRRTSGEIAIERAVEAAKEVMETLSTGEIAAELAESDQSFNLDNAIDLLEDRLEDIELPDNNANPTRIYRAINEYCEPYLWDDNTNPSAILTALSFPYEDRPFDFKKTDDGQYTLRLIGDKGQHPFFADRLASFEQIGMVAGPEGERFLDSLPGRPKAIEIENFRYDADYHVFALDPADEDEFSLKGEQRQAVRNVTKELNRRGKPQIAVAGTHEGADRLAADLAQNVASTIVAPEDPEKNIHRQWLAGSTAVIYENSVVSRGIDAPFFDITTIPEPGFAAPYWEARVRYLQSEAGNRAPETVHSKEVLHEHKAREFTNAAFRSSQTRPLTDSPRVWSKFVVVAEKDLEKLKFIDHRVHGPFTDTGDVADMIDLLAVDGPVEREAQRVWDGLDGNATEYLKAMTDDTLHLTPTDRPGYDMDEVERWIENGHISEIEAEERMEEVLKGEDDGLSTREACDRAPWHNDKAVVILEILEEKGIVTSETISDGTPGEPERRWRLV